jgi:hypothetical protein
MDACLAIALTAVGPNGSQRNEIFGNGVERSALAHGYRSCRRLPDPEEASEEKKHYGAAR